MRHYGIALAVLVIMVSLATTAWAENKTVVASVDGDGVQRVEVLAGSYFYNPNHIVVKVNIPVEFKVRRESGVTPHNIVAKAREAGIDFAEELDTEAKTIRFTPTKPGKYPFYCDKRFLFFKSHREQGMEGIIEVVE